MATKTERWNKDVGGVEITYDRRAIEGKPEDDYVTLSRKQVESLLVQAGYEKENPNG